MFDTDKARNENRMKQKLPLSLFLLLLASCTNILDKPVNPQTFSRDSSLLTQNKKYEAADFVLLKHYVKHLPADSLSKPKTYREVLDSVYNRRALRAKMKQALSVKVLYTSLERKRRTKGLVIQFWQTIQIINHEEYPTTDIEGYLYITNLANDTLNIIGLFNSNKVYPNLPDTSNYLSAIFYNHDKSKAFDTISADDLNFLWSPQKIVFTNGEMLIVKDSIDPDKYFK